MDVSYELALSDNGRYVLIAPPSLIHGTGLFTTADLPAANYHLPPIPAEAL